MQFCSAWTECDSWVQQVVTEGLKLPFARTPPTTGRRIDSGSSPGVRTAIEEFVQKGVLEKATTPGLTARLFVVKQNEKMRPVYDARFVNRFMHAQHFQMEDMRTLGALIQREDWMVKIDLKDAYLHVPIHPAYRKYLQIHSKEETYQFKALPFGLNIAPQVFTRILKAALKPLRKRGFRFAAYLDDICLLAPSKEAAERQGKEMVQHLQQKGFIMNTKRPAWNRHNDGNFSD